MITFPGFRELISAYAIVKKSAANANYGGKRLDAQQHKLIIQCIAGHEHERAIKRR
jgi:fumarate hydratase class II